MPLFAAVSVNVAVRPVGVTGRRGVPIGWRGRYLLPVSPAAIDMATDAQRDNTRRGGHVAIRREVLGWAAAVTAGGCSGTGAPSASVSQIDI